MLYCRRLFQRAVGGATVTRSNLTPLEALTQLQLGITPPISAQRGFLLEHCRSQMEQRGITEAKLLAMEGSLCTNLLKQLVYERYLSVPFRVYAFDMEFTGPPVFTADGPTEDITEFGLYSPARDETFSCLVKPACGRKLGPDVVELTHITEEMLEKEGLPFLDAWQQFLNFVNTPEPGELPGSEQRILLLSHGGKLADVSLIKWTLEKCRQDLPSSFVFGDTIHLIRDAHRRRPVTLDKHPPSWKLGDLVQWLKVPMTLPAHRAGNDAKMTWDALYHTLDRYGDDELSPRDQLVPRFFDEEARQRMREQELRDAAQKDPLGGNGLLTDDIAYDTGGSGSESDVAGAQRNGAHGTSTSNASEDLLNLDFDEIFTSQQRGGQSSSSSSFMSFESNVVAQSSTAHQAHQDTDNVAAAAAAAEADDSDFATTTSSKPAAETQQVSPKRSTKKAAQKPAVKKRGRSPRGVASLSF